MGSLREFETGASRDFTNEFSEAEPYWGEWETGEL